MGGAASVAGQGAQVVGEGIREVERGVTVVAEEVKNGAVTLGTEVKKGAVTLGKEMVRAGTVLKEGFDVLGDLLIDDQFRDRFFELLDKGLVKVLKALATPKSCIPDKDLVVGHTFAKWMVDAGGFFPKLAQVVPHRAH
ncbi:hypothetical protein CYMTET_44171 [Cymbomonas tetramitiformis]|uniref:Uncharacterized protein n=1 Tax=Cymbomonas tetramitiformis TaxID=36881 RepID=A0AAE0C1Z5_9CHLO|nr:hypothetical protein CYMTET_44171 [Cymbomonas tetramitiformis]